MSSGRPMSVVRPAQYTGPDRSTPVRARARAKVTARPTGTSTPAPRRTRANATAIRSTLGGVSIASGTAANGRADDVSHAVGAHPLLVLAVLEQRAQRDLDRPLVEARPAEGGQRHRPVDRLGHPGRLVELERPHRLGGRRQLPGKRLGHVGGTDKEEGELLVDI